MVFFCFVVDVPRRITRAPLERDAAVVDLCDGTYALEDKR